MSILDDLKQAKAEMKGEELPVGAQPVAEEEKAAPAEETPAAEIPEAEKEEKPAVAARAEEDEDAGIQIGDQFFKTQEEAIAYARKLEQEKLVSEAYNMGIKETLQQVRPPEVEAPPEENFEEKFYADPKGTLQKIKEEAKQEALSSIKAEQRAAQMWNTFLNQYPDIEQRDAQRILSENWDTIGAMTDVDKAMKALAQKTRAEYQRIAERLKPRTELPPNRNAQAVSAGRGGVTPPPQPQKHEKPLTFAEELKNMRRR